MTKHQIVRVTDDKILRLLKAARPYVEDRLHRPDGEIDGSVAQLLSSLDTAIGTSSPQSRDTPRSALVDVPAVESEPVALIEREVLAQLAKQKTATGTVCSPLFKGKFGDKVPLFAHPPRSLSNEGWMPIETAPKDGTEILLYREDCGVILGRWVSPCEFLNEGEYADAESWELSDWFGADFVTGYRVTNDGDPTHWQPLPTPPLSTRKGSAGDGAATGTTGTTMAEYEPLITFNGMAWALCRARRHNTCYLTHRPIKPGDHVYRPISNGPERMRRIKAGHQHKLPTTPAIAKT